MTRVVAYVDGFNLYFGLKAKGWKKHYWLDLKGLATSLLKPGQTLEGVHYFTSRIQPNGRNVADMQRQSDYLDALATLPSLTIHYGHYLQKSKRCLHCGATSMDYEEKMTDVNIAMQLLTDAFDDHVDTALVISADSDLTTPVRQVRARFPAQRGIVAPSPGPQLGSTGVCRNGSLHHQRNQGAPEPVACDSNDSQRICVPTPRTLAIRGCHDLPQHPRFTDPQGLRLSGTRYRGVRQSAKIPRHPLLRGGGDAAQSEADTTRRGVVLREETIDESNPVGR